ncbi:MAG: ABC transporter substrate binding protein [Candidatus Wallbacteria bacterium]
MFSKKKNANYEFIFYLKILKYFVVTIIIVVFSSNLCRAAQSDVKNILMFNSYHKGYEWSDNIFRGFAETIKKEFGDSVEFYYEYLDAKRHYKGINDDYSHKFDSILTHKYHNLKMDAIFVSDKDGYEFLLSVKAKLFPGVPLIFSGIEEIEDGYPKNEVTGIISATDYKGNIDLILKVLPETERIVILTDNTSTGSLNKKHLKEIAAEYRQQFYFLDDNGFGTENKIIDAVKTLKKTDVIFISDCFRNSEGNYIEYKTFIPELTKNSAVPVFYHADMFLNLGVTGGKMISGYYHGVDAAGLVLRILKGEKVSNIPVLKITPHRNMFDYKQLERFGIKINSLPLDSIVINRPDNLYEKYFYFIVIGIIFVISQLLVIVILIFNARKIKKMNAVLKNSEEMYRFLFESANDSIFTIKKNKFESCNIRALAMFEVEKSEILGKNILQFSAEVQPDGKKSEEMAEYYIDKAETGSPQFFEWKHVTQNGRPIDTEVSLTKFSVANEVYLIAIVRDITERKRNETLLIESEKSLRLKNEEYIALNEELNEINKKIQTMNEELIAARDKAEESNRLKSSFLANMSHEIRTPMNGIMGFSLLICDEHCDIEKRKFYSKIIKDCCNQLLTIIDDILDISKIETGQLEIIKKPMQLNGLMNYLKTFFYERIQEKKLELIIENNDNVPECNIITDETRLYQIFNNLIGNAIKFTDKGYIKVGYEISGEYVQFHVIDTGHGIDDKDKDKLFKRFSKIESRASQKYHGTGLGLLICKNLVELLGGKIWFESVPGSGTKFFFTIPYILAKKSEKNVELKKNIDDELSNLSGFTILVADDEYCNYFYICEILSDTGLNVLRAENGVEAIEMCRQHPEIKLVLMDIKMPILSGYDAAEKIIEFRPDLPIIAQTAFDIPEYAEKSLNKGFKAHIAKPIERAEFIKIFRRYIMQ